MPTNWSDKIALANGVMGKSRILSSQFSASHGLDGPMRSSFLLLCYSLPGSMPQAFWLLLLLECSSPSLAFDSWHILFFCLEHFFLQLIFCLLNQTSLILEYPVLYPGSYSWHPLPLSTHASGSSSVLLCRLSPWWQQLLVQWTKSLGDELPECWSLFCLPLYPQHLSQDLEHSGLDT